METKEKVFNLIILDESGSMHSIKNEIVSGFNEVVQTIKTVAQRFPEQEHYISFVTFNGDSIKTLLNRENVLKLDELNTESYRPANDTPLLDAIGQSVGSLEEAIRGYSNYHVLVTILTDGYENSSSQFTAPQIKNLIEMLKEKKWTFTYIGTEHDVDAVAFSLSITNKMVFKKNPAAMKLMFTEESQARLRYSSRIANKEDVSDDFYENKP